jgi:hypothetical protein
MKMPERIQELVQEMETAGQIDDSPRAKMNKRAAKLIRKLYNNDENEFIEEGQLDSLGTE